MKLNKFYLKRSSEIIFEKNSYQKLLKQISNKKILIFTSKSHSSNKIMVNFLRDQKKNNYFLNDKIQSHADLDNIWKIYNEVKSFLNKNKVDFVLAIGGGSVLDVAKILSIVELYKKNFLRKKEFFNFLIKNDLNFETFKYIAIPTTSGTSSEMTQWSTLWDPQNKLKFSILNNGYFPQAIIYDPLVTTTLSKENTMISALDALSHSFESIWNKNTSDYVINNSVIAINLIIEYLPKLLKDLRNVDLRSKLMLASYFAGKAFSLTETSVAHSMSYYITLNKNIPHGIACSFILPHLIDHIDKQKNYFVFQALEKALGISPKKKLNSFFKKIKVSTKFEDYSINKKEFIEIISSAKKSPRYKNSLIKLDKLIY